MVIRVCVYVCAKEAICVLAEGKQMIVMCNRKLRLGYNGGIIVVDWVIIQHNHAKIIIIIKNIYSFGLSSTPYYK